MDGRQIRGNSAGIRADSACIGADSTGVRADITGVGANAPSVRADVARVCADVAVVALNGQVVGQSGCSICIDIFGEGVKRTLDARDVPIVSVNLSLKAGHIAIGREDFGVQVGLHLSDFAAVCTVERVDACTERGLSGYGTVRFIGNPLGVLCNVLSHHIVYIPLVGQVVIGNGRLSAQDVACK